MEHHVTSRNITRCHPSVRAYDCMHAPIRSSSLAPGNVEAPALPWPSSITQTDCRPVKGSPEIFDRLKHVRCNLDVCPELMSHLPNFDPS